MKSRRWTKEETEKLKELYSTVISVADIARGLGRNRVTVLQKANCLGLERPRELRYRLQQPPGIHHQDCLPRIIAARNQRMVTALPGLTAPRQAVALR
ncbi:MAG: hypothetical protein HY670_04920 [Chloroflexi bacterium]|nr:hypothetical protein [Chloroflexota bacterium]